MPRRCNVSCMTPGGRARLAPMLQLDNDLAAELEARDELLVACREVLAGTASRAASALVQHIDAVLDLGEDDAPLAYC